MKPSIVLYKKISADLLKRLEQHYSVVQFNGITAENRTQVYEALEQAEGLIGSGGPINKELIDHALACAPFQPPLPDSTVSTSPNSAVAVFRC